MGKETRAFFPPVDDRQNNNSLVLEVYFSLEHKFLIFSLAYPLLMFYFTSLESWATGLRASGRGVGEIYKRKIDRVIEIM